MNEMTNTADTADTFYDASEFYAAMARPEYKTSARYRDEVAAKLQRSQAAGTVGSQSSIHRHDERTHTVTASSLELGLYGGAQPMPKAVAFDVQTMNFRTAEQLQAAVDSPSYADPTYRDALIRAMTRSMREGTMDQGALALAAQWAAEADAFGGRA